MRVNHINQNQGRQTEQQLRLRLRTDRGTLDLVSQRRDGTEPLRWAWPGGGSRTYGDVVRLCRARDWPPPELLPARVVRRTETGEPTPHDEE